MAKTPKKNKIMALLARWHIWLGWLVGVPIVMWTATGLLMVAKPIEEVRGSQLRLPADNAPLIIEGSAIATAETQVKEMRVTMQDGRAVAILTTLDGATRRVDMASGAPIPALDAASARAIVSQRIAGGDAVRAVTLFEADEVPFDFRRAIAVWQIVLADGAHIYIGRDTGEIEAVRTTWWRWFDFAWGLHIMDLSEREDTSHPVLIGFTALSLIGTLFGAVLMFRRRKTRITPSSKAGTAP
jgi:hypothetical protein